MRPGVPAVAPRARGQRGAGGSAGAEAGAQGWERAGRARRAEVAIACATFLQSCVSALGRPGRRTPRRGAPEPAPRGKPPRPWEGREKEVYIKGREIRQVWHEVGWEEKGGRGRETGNESEGTSSSQEKPCSTFSVAFSKHF